MKRILQLIICIALLLTLAGCGGESSSYSYQFTDFYAFLQQDSEAMERLGQPYGYEFDFEELGMRDRMRCWYLHDRDVDYCISLVDRYVTECLEPEGFKLKSSSWEQEKYSSDGYDQRYEYVLDYKGGGLEKVESTSDKKGELLIFVSLEFEPSVQREYVVVQLRYTPGLSSSMPEMEPGFTGPEKYFEEKGGPQFVGVSREIRNGIICRSYVCPAEDSLEQIQSSVEQYIFDGLGRQGMHVTELYSAYADTARVYAFDCRGAEENFKSERSIVPEDAFGMNAELYLFYNQADQCYELELSYDSALKMDDKDISHSYEPTVFDGEIMGFNAFLRQELGESPFEDPEWSDVYTGEKLINYRTQPGVMSDEEMKAYVDLYTDKVLIPEGFVRVGYNPDWAAYYFVYLGDGLDTELEEEPDYEGVPYDLEVMWINGGETGTMAYHVMLRHHPDISVDEPEYTAPAPQGETEQGELIKGFGKYCDEAEGEGVMELSYGGSPTNERYWLTYSVGELSRDEVLKLIENYIEAELVTKGIGWVYTAPYTEESVSFGLDSPYIDSDDIFEFSLYTKTAEDGRLSVIMTLPTVYQLDEPAYYEYVKD